MSTTTKAIGAVAVLAVIGLVILQLVGGSYGADRPGDPAVYQRIEGLTSCSALQSEFDAASARHDARLRGGNNDQAEIETSYMTAADTRMRDLGCHK